jgi:hypothetical protein
MELVANDGWLSVKGRQAAVWGSTYPGLFALWNIPEAMLSERQMPPFTVPT